MSDRGSWAEDRERNYLVGLSVSAAAWLEEMLEPALASGALPKPRDEWGQPIEAPRAPSIDSR